MGKKSQMLLITLVFLIIMLAPLILGKFFPLLKVMIMFYLALIIFLFVRRILGTGILSYLVSGILIYIFVIKFYYLAVPVYMLYLIGSMMLSGIIIFGLQKHG